MRISIKDLSDENIDDVFSICSIKYSDNPLVKRGIEIKRNWMKKMLNKGICVTKVGYANGKPIAQLLYYPEREIPYVPNPRKEVLKINCVYNPFPKFQKLGIAKRLVKSLIKD
ncbi:MAG: hypothetical protein DRN49_05345, partial [Thaumarchaeota archaeon]